MEQDQKLGHVDVVLSVNVTILLTVQLETVGIPLWTDTVKMLSRFQITCYSKTNKNLKATPKQRKEPNKQKLDLPLNKQGS